MKRILHLAFRVLELTGLSSGPTRDRAHRFVDVAHAVSVLRRYGADAANLAALRAFVASERVALSVHRLDDDEVIAVVARALVAGRAVAFERRREQLSSFGDEGELTPLDDAPDDQATRTQKTWIEIELVDLEGLPVKGAPYWIKLVDGSIVEGSLDGDGRARVDGIDPGTCEIHWPEHDEEAVQLATVDLTPPKPVLEDAPPPEPDETATIDGPAQARALEEAARSGVPFCEECEKAKQQRRAAATA
jgi:hypothetical protein